MQKIITGKIDVRITLDIIIILLCRLRENRINNIESDQRDPTLARMKYIIECWEDWNPQKWKPELNRDRSFGDALPLMYPAGRHRNEAWGNRGMETPTSMRSVDALCEAEVLPNRYTAREDL